MTNQTQALADALELARFFHDTYERLAPSFGYETRPDTKAFDPSSANGRLMTAVCREVLATLSQYEKSDTYTKQRIAELVAEGDGFWRPCSGCQEGCDGYVSKEDYPYNDTFRCQPGSGCRECGGIGVIWDDTDYEDYARFALGEKSDTDRDQLREAVQQARDYLLEVGNDYPGSSCQKWCTEKATEVWNAVKPWEHCPSTHCERTQECRSVNECAANKRAALASKTAIDPATVERDKLIEALTPSGDTKAAYSGDFKINVEIENVDFEEDEDESDHNPRTLMMPVTVDWTTIKDIMKAIRIRALGKDQ